MSDFDSLTIAIEDWFDKPLSDMPDSIRQRIEKDMFPLPWDDLSPEQRRIGALQLDYQHDPATEKERQYWWDFFLQKDALKRQIAEWENAATPTATDLAHKEAKLKELRNELSRMDQQERQPQRPYVPDRTKSASSSAGASAQTSANFIAYPKAMQLLANRLNATPEELAAWIFYGAEEGGLSAYTNANELNPPPKFFYGYHTGAEDYIAPLMACWFNEEDIANFQPVERYITGKALIERWSKQAGIHPAAFIRAKIAESRLMDMHPTFGGTEATFSSIGSFPAIETGLFAMSDVRDIEKEDGIAPSMQSPVSNEETKETRQRRFKIRIEELKARRVKNFLETLAEEEGLSVSRVKQIVYDKKETVSNNPETPRNPWAGLTTQNSQTSSKKLKHK